MLVDAELVRAGAATLSLPQNAALAARLVWETADVIWTGLGDGSRDVNWYSKRATLSAVVSATVLFWLGDDSPDHRETRAFIDRRIDGVMRFEQVKSTLRKLPGAEKLAQMAFGWIRAPGSRDLPGRTRP
ncbi:COQ9 family protein [Paracoccus aerius]